MLFLRANLLVLSVCSGQRPLKIRMPSVLPPGILIWLGMSATSIEVSEPGTLHATLHAACCACSACSAPHLRRFGVTEASRQQQRGGRRGAECTSSSLTIAPGRAAAVDLGGCDPDFRIAFSRLRSRSKATGCSEPVDATRPAPSPRHHRKFCLQHPRLSNRDIGTRAPEPMTRGAGHRKNRPPRAAGVKSHDVECSRVLPTLNG